MDDEKDKVEPTEEAKPEAEETEDEEVEVSDKVMKALEDTVSDVVSQKIDSKLDQIVQKLEPVTDKRVTTPVVEVKDELEQMPKEVRFVKGLKAMLTGDRAALIRHNEYARTKAGYQSEGTDADGGYLVPDPDFLAEVARLEESYGVASKDARVINVRSDSLKMNKKATGISFYATEEAAQKTGTNMTFGQDTITLSKYAAIASVTDELTEDAAVNIFNELAIDFARGKAQKEDEIVFTDTATGIIRTAGTAAVTVGAAITSLTFDHLNTAVHSVPTDSMRSGKFYLHRTMLGLIQRIKDTTNNYIWQPGVNGTVDGTIWGFPYELAEVMPDVADVGDANEPYIIFGYLRYYTLIRKANGLQLTSLREGTVHDSDGNAVNLAEKDMTALRAVFRASGVLQFPASMCLIGTGTVS